jgi:hypothetical protein
MDLPARGGADAFVRPEDPADWEGHDFSRAVKAYDPPTALATEAKPSKRMLAVLQFSEDDDMAFTMDRMFTKPNAMRDRLSSGRCFLRFVVIEDQDQRRSICSALNQWIINSAEKASGIPAGFSSSLELTTDSAGSRVARAPSPASARSATAPAHAADYGQEAEFAPAAPQHDSGGNKNLHCPQPFPSGF